MMTYTDFKNLYLGTPINYDNAWGAQCMDVYRQYVKEVLGCPQSPPVTGARNVWYTYLPEYFERIENSADNMPQQGDIVIWNIYPYGHIAICDHATASTLTCFEQNWREGNGTGVTELRTHENYKNVLGWLRYKGKPVAEAFKILKYKRATYEDFYFVPESKEEEFNLAQKDPALFYDFSMDIKNKITPLGKDLSAYLFTDVKVDMVRIEKWFLEKDKETK